MLKVGDVVRLVTPDNPRLDGVEAVITVLTEWGAHVRTVAAATGQFRAHHSEMVPHRPSEAGELGFDPEPCPTCGSYKMKRSGTCKVCLECGSTTGCS